MSKELKAVFTWLEKTTPPGNTIAAPLAERLALMRAPNMPMEFYRFLIDRIGGPYHWVQRMRLPENALRIILDADTTEIFVLYLEGVPAGFFEIDRRGRDTAHIVHFGLMEHARGRRLSGWFLHTALEAAWTEGTERITIGTTSLDHPSALRLYQRFGFVVTERTSGSVIPLTEQERRDCLL